MKRELNYLIEAQYFGHWNVVCNTSYVRSIEELRARRRNDPKRKYRLVEVITERKVIEPR